MWVKKESAACQGYIISILYLNVYYVYCILYCHITKLTWIIDLSLNDCIMSGEHWGILYYIYIIF